jgi:hypothetical protein
MDHASAPSSPKHPADRTSNLQSAMKTHPSLIRIIVVVAVALAFAAALRAETSRYASMPLSTVTTDSTSNIHDWQAVGGAIGGFMDLDSRIKIGSVPAGVAPGKVEASAEVRIVVRSLKSGKDEMDNIMHDASKQSASADIGYKLKTLVLKAKPEAASEPWEFDSVGDLDVAGKTKKVAMPVKMSRAKDGKVHVQGSVKVKMTDFGVKPPAPKIPGMIIATGDEVTLTINWRTEEKSQAK